jgi:cyclophilin family peptidyl-prolyl cis-trans isomerase
MRSRFFVLPVLALLLGAACQKESVTVTPTPCSSFRKDPSVQTTYTYPGKLTDEKILNKQVRVATAKGDIVFELLAADAPCTVSNFVYLAESGFYNGLKFHRREEGFVIQGGDPNGDGTGGPGYTFADEPVTRNYDRGIVAMANAGPNTNGSQFFIMLQNNATLPKNYTVFGRVTAGQDVVDAIAVGDAMTAVVVEPLNP